MAPTKRPTKRPTKKPSARRVTRKPSSSPSVTSLPSQVPSHLPSRKPSEVPSRKPSAKPSRQPSRQPSHVPSSSPSSAPTASPAPSAVPSQVPSASPSGEVCTETIVCPANGHRYWVGPGRRTYAQAEDIAARMPECCGGRKAHLATVTTDDEHSFLSKVLWDIGAPGGWIGLNDKQTEGTFKWVTGEKLKKTYWMDGNPSDEGVMDCVGMWHLGSTEGYWTTLKCDTVRPDLYTIIEYDCA